VKVKRYSKEDKINWDDFLKEAKNSHFMFFRDYMDYHSDRFSDHSLLFYDNKEKLVAVLPANKNGNELISHQGLSFGGLLIKSEFDTLKFVQCIDALILYCKENSFNTLLYKKIPTIYSSSLSEEDSYALFYKGAELYRRDLNCAVDYKVSQEYSKSRTRNVKKAKKNGISCLQSNEDIEEFYRVLSANLSTVHNLVPPHSLEELNLLQTRFPENILLFVAKKDDQVLAGVLVFVTRFVIHAQYIASTEEGRRIGALDLLFDHIIKSFEESASYFSFGVSTEDSGKFINEGLVFQKEGFGARAYVHDFYRLEI